MKLFTLMMLFIFSLSAMALTNKEFPLGPNASITPGDVCRNSGTLRYPEQISYCKRDVSSARKKVIFDDYRKLGFELPANDRGSYKIDHYIPLCAGGSNSSLNLWPQHKSVYDITDPIEPLLCQKMSDGRLKQSEAIELIRKVKNDLSQAQEVTNYLNHL